MRFAYIDSNGNEVPIPSVDALALRIELGAINEQTELYDALADQWGPAHTHEIFHTLARDVEGNGGFVAPPPPVPAPAPKPKSPEKVEEAASGDAADDGPTAGLTLAEPPPPTVEEPEAGSSPDDRPAFDFGDLTGGLEMESEPESPPPAEDGPALDLSLGNVEDAASEGFGSDLEPPMTFESGIGRVDPSAASGLALERPMSEFQAENPPAWMAPPEAEVGEDVMDFSSVAADAPAERKAPVAATAPRARPKKKKAKPRAGRDRSLGAPIVGVVLLSVAAVGGYVAWPIVSARFSAPPDDSGPTVVLPALANELMPGYREAAGTAFATVIRDARARVGVGVARPPQDWLAGVYFANASQYPQVEAFWLGVQDELVAVLETDEDDFLAAFEAGLSSAGMGASEREAALARARVGYDVSARARAETFDAVELLVDAALGLHTFLLANEDDIQHTPASTLTVDPVLEAQASSPAVGEGLRQRISEVTEALDGLDYLDLVTRDGLWAAVGRRLQEVGIR